MQIVPGSEDDVPGLISINPRGDEARERARWEGAETVHTARTGITGHFKPGNPWIKGNPNRPDSEGRGAAGAEYPKMLYKALENPRLQGKLMCMEPEPPAYLFVNDDQYQRARDGAAAFTAACQRTVRNEAEEREAKTDGWRNTPKEAMDGGKKAQFEEFTQACHREWDDRNMSDKAKAEIRAKELLSDGRHVLEVKEQPRQRKKPGPKPKVKEAPPVA